MSERYGYGTYEDNDNRSELARPAGFTKDGRVAGDYLASGRDPHLPRQSPQEIAQILKAVCPNCKGSGEVASPAGSTKDKWPCPDCNATGLRATAQEGK